MELQKKPGKYIHGGCGTIIDLPLNPKRSPQLRIPSRTECGLGKVYCTSGNPNGCAGMLCK